MSIDTKTIKHIANLAQLDLSDDELHKFPPELSNILELVTQMQRVDTSDVQAMTHPYDATLSMRDDIMKKSNRRDELLQNAPVKENGLFLVPKVID